jgi:hypothetical protein
MVPSLRESSSVRLRRDAVAEVEECPAGRRQAGAPDAVQRRDDQATRSCRGMRSRSVVDPPLVSWARSDVSSSPCEHLRFKRPTYSDPGSCNQRRVSTVSYVMVLVRVQLVAVALVAVACTNSPPANSDSGPPPPVAPLPVVRSANLSGPKDSVSRCPTRQVSLRLTPSPASEGAPLHVSGSVPHRRKDGSYTRGPVVEVWWNVPASDWPSLTPGGTDRAQAESLFPGAMMLARFKTGESCRFDAEVRVPSGPMGPHSVIVLSTGGGGAALLDAQTLNIQAG